MARAIFRRRWHAQYQQQRRRLRTGSTWALADHIEAGFADGATGHAVALPGGAAATTGQADVILVGSDTTVSTPTGFTLASTFVGNQGGYGFYRICSGGESATVTITTAVNANTNVHFSRWSGGAAFDVAANAHVDGSGNTANPAISTGTLATANDLVVTAAVMTDAVGSNATAPSWSAGYVPIGAASSGTSTSASVGFSAYRTGAGTAAESPLVTWTNSMRNRYIFALTFTLANGSTPITAGDTGSSTEALTVTVTAPLAETAAAADAPAETASTALTDTGAAADAAAVTSPVPVGDSASATQAISVSVTTAFADAAAGSESISEAFTVSLADTAAAGDQFADAVTAVLTDAGSAAQSLSLGTTVPLADAGSAAAVLTVDTGGVVLKTLTETGSAADTIRVHRTSIRPYAGITIRPQLGVTARP